MASRYAEARTCVHVCRVHAQTHTCSDKRWEGKVIVGLQGKGTGNHLSVREMTQITLQEDKAFTQQCQIRLCFTFIEKKNGSLILPKSAQTNNCIFWCVITLSCAWLSWSTLRGGARRAKICLFTVSSSLWSLLYLFDMKHYKTGGKKLSFKHYSV